MVTVVGPDVSVRFELVQMVTSRNCEFAGTVAINGTVLPPGIAAYVPNGTNDRICHWYTIFKPTECPTADNETPLPAQTLVAELVISAALGWPVHPTRLVTISVRETVPHELVTVSVTVKMPLAG